MPASSASVAALRWLTAAAAFSLITLGPSLAEACGACTCDAPQGIRPQLVNEPAPLNARFLLALHHLDGYGVETTIDPDAITWTDAEGNAVEFDVVPTDGAYDEVWLVPREPLADSTDYVIEAATGGEYPLQNYFTTGTDTDETAPDGPPATAEPITSSPACGAFDGARLRWEEARDDVEVMGYRAIVELHVESGENTAVLFADATPLYPDHGVDLAVPGGEESAQCWGTLALPFEAANEPLTVTAQLYDLAGNIRHFDPVEVTLGAVPGATCPGEPPSGSDGAAGAGSDSDGQRGGGTCAVVGPTRRASTTAGWWLVILAATVGRRLADRRVLGPKQPVRR